MNYYQKNRTLALNILLVITVMLFMQGCATYGNSIDDVRTQVATGQFNEAELSLQSAVKSYGDDELLFYLESGMIQHFKGEYLESNRLLEQAYRLIDPMNRQQFSDRLKQAAINPKSTIYLGTDFERSMVNFVKLINYLNLATQAETEVDKQDALESARVESRRIRIALDLVDTNEGEVSEKTQKKYREMNQLIGDMMGDYSDAPVEFSPVPLLDWLTSVIFELQSEQDDARIALGRALAGYTQGYGHSPENPTLIKDFSEQTVSGEVETGELIILQMTSLIPEQKEVSFFTGIQGNGLYFSANYSSSHGDENEQAIWFDTVMSGPTGYQLWLGHANGNARITTNPRRRIYFNTVSDGYFESESPFWNVLIQGFRVALSYYPPNAYLLDSQSKVLWQDQQADLHLGLSVARKAVEDHSAQAWRELYLSFAREFFQQLLAETLYQNTKNSDQALTSMIGLVGKVAAYAGAQSDTRSWLTLPREINVARVRLPVGEQTLKVQTNFRYSNYAKEQEINVNIEPGGIHFVSLYTSDQPDFSEPTTVIE